MIPSTPALQLASAGSSGIWNPSNRKAGQTVRPTRVQSPRLRADCQASAGTMLWGRSSEARSGPRRTAGRPRVPGVRCGVRGPHRNGDARSPPHRPGAIDFPPRREAGNRWRFRGLSRMDPQTDPASSHGRTRLRDGVRDRAVQPPPRRSATSLESMRGEWVFRQTRCLNPDSLARVELTPDFQLRGGWVRIRG